MLVANAGMTRDQLLALISEDAFTVVLDTNLTGAYRVAKRAVRGMMKLRRGRLIFISSVVGLSARRARPTTRLPRPGWSGWPGRWPASSAPANITANVVAPGFVDSDMTADLSQDRKAAILAGVPLARFASADEVPARSPSWPAATPPTSPAP